MLKFPIVHLRRTDFDSRGKIVSGYFKNKTTAVMIYSDSCHYCHVAVPDFKKASEEVGKSFVFAAIQLNGKVSGEKECSGILKNILYEYRGVPDYAFFVDGVPVKVKTESRSSREIIKILKSLKKKNLSHS